MALSAVEVAWRAKVAEGVAGYAANIAANEAEKHRTENQYLKAQQLGQTKAKKEKARKEGDLST